MRTRWLCLILSALLGSASLTAHADSPAPPFDAEPRFAVPPPPMGGEAPAPLVRRTPPRPHLRGGPGHHGGYAHATPVAATGSRSVLRK
jgi:hypothetical protein